MGKYLDALIDQEPKKQESEKPTSENRINYFDSLTLGDLGPEDPWIGSKPLSSVMNKELFREQKEPADFATHFVAGFADDPQTKLRIYAATRFPNLPEKERLKRYGIDNGEVVYMGNDGHLYRETPDTWLQKLKRFSAETGAHTPAIIMSIIGSLGGPGLAALGAMGGEGLRKSFAGAFLNEPQTAMGNLMDMAKEGVIAYGGDIAGRGISRGLNKIGAMKGGKLASQAGPLRREISPGAVLEMEQAGREFGIDLYPPQTTGSKRLADKFSLLGDLEASAPIIQAARKKQVEQIDAAVYSFLDNLASAKGTVSETGERLVNAAKKALMRPINIRRAKAAPLYRKAFEEKSVQDINRITSELAFNKQLIKRLSEVEPELDISKMVSELKDRGVPTMRVIREGDKEYAKRIAQDYKRITGNEIPMTGGKKDFASINSLKERNVAIEQALAGKPPEGFTMPTKPLRIDPSDAIKQIDELLSVTVKQDPSYRALSRIKAMIQEAGGNLQKLDRVKRSGIDNILNKTKTNRTLSREMKLVKDKLVGAMDEAVPEYAKARKVFSELSEEVEKQSRKTILGDVAKLEGDQVVNATRKFLSSPEVKRSPQIARKIRNAIVKTDPEVWNMAIANHLQELFESTKQSITGGITNIGGHFYKKVWGDLAQRNVLKHAMMPQQFNTLKRFMKVLERSGMILGKESATATRQVMLEEMQGRTLGRMVRAATRPLYTKERLLGDRLLESILSKNARKLAEAMTSQRAAAQLKRMYQLSPTSRKLLPAITNFLALVAAGEFSRERQLKKVGRQLPVVMTPLDKQ